MQKTSALPDPLRSHTWSRDVIVFDGECVLCSGFFQFMLKHDTAQRFSFATAQSQLGQQLYRALGLPTDDFETNLVIVDGLIYQRLDASPPRWARWVTLGKRCKFCGGSLHC